MRRSPARVCPRFITGTVRRACARFADILTVSNFSGKGPARVGSYDGLGPFGTYDMAGNVKEWCWTERTTADSSLGGAWNEPRYMFADYDAKGRSSGRRITAFVWRNTSGRYRRPLAAPVRIESLVRDARKRNRSAMTSSRCIGGSTPTIPHR